MPYLVLVRHGQSEWNAKGIWTGKTDVSLTDKGRQEARGAGVVLKDITFDAAHVSTMKRAKQTYDEIMTEIGQSALEPARTATLDERDYGDLTGKNKWQVKEEHGEELFMKWRRSWDYPVPGGETLKDVYDRAAPYYDEHILPDLEAGKNVIVAASGNSLRALVKRIEHISNDDIPHLEIGTGEVYVYDVDPKTGDILSKAIRVAGGKA